MRLPYVIDNRSEETSMSHVLSELLARHEGRAVDVASAFFSVHGFSLLHEALDKLGNFRLLLGTEPAGGLDLGLTPSARAGSLRIEDYRGDILHAHAEDLRRELERDPLSPETERLVENLIRFLREERVQVRRYAKGFLHAKTWLFYTDRSRSGQAFLWDRFEPLIGIVGSSNFTRAGLTANNELNLSHQVLLDDEAAVDAEAASAVRYLGEESAGPLITPKNRRLIKSEVGARAIEQLVKWYEEVWAESVDYKEDLIRVLSESKYGDVLYDPWDIYLKALWHYFGGEDGVEPETGATAIELTEFQEDGVKRAKRILAKYGGVMVADSVGLGKTWIGKRLLEEWGYHQRQQVLVISPASLKGMWQKELTGANIAHRAISQESMGQPGFNPYEFGDADIVLIDESHNFRNHRSRRYEALEQIIGHRGGRGRAGLRKKVILLTATPINNNVFDLYNQLGLIAQWDDGHFAAAGIGDMRKYFLAARKAHSGDTGINLFNILEEVVVRRPRAFIRDNYPDATINGNPIHWPERELHTLHYSLAATYGEHFYRRIVEGIDRLRLAPFDLESHRKEPETVDQWTAGRGQALVGIFKSLYLKRFESSVEAFRISIDRARRFQQAYRKQLRQGKLLTAKDFRKLHSLQDEQSDQDNADEIADLLDELERVAVDEYDLPAIEAAVDADLQTLSEIYGQASGIEVQQDAKYQKLRKTLRESPTGQKVIIFSYFKDTSRYLYRCLSKDEELLADLGNPTMRIADSDVTPGDRDRIVEHFAPRSNKVEGIAGTDREIQLLVSTDVLSEGKNLQDCQYMINYDLHWAPTRMVQRAGRIDRIGTEFDVLHISNFFPETHLDEMLRLVETLQGKIGVIDAQGLHDASVLGEIPHPRAFNQIKRIEGEDTSVIDEEERAAELASPEELRMKFQEALKDGHREAAEKLPDGIHSVRRRPADRGIFFCFEAHPDDPDKRRCFWLYWDHNTRQFDDNAYRISAIIACDPQEPRGATADTVYDLLPRAIDHLVQASKRTAAAVHAKRKISSEQKAVQTAITQHAIEAKVDRRRVLATAKFLGEPMANHVRRRLANAYKTYNTSGDIVSLVDTVDDLRLALEGPPEETHDEQAQPLTAEDLHLVCFEYVVA